MCQVANRRILLFRFGAVCFGLLLLIAVELTLRLFGAGKPSDTVDPLVGFSEIVPLFVLNSEGTRFETASSRRSFFRPESFQSQKGNSEFRIFCFGGSTVQGRPYAIETSFTTWLELKLKAADPSREWDVINCGGVSYASYRLIPLIQEALTHQPDLFIVYTGHNEFLEARSYDNIKQLPAWQKGLLEYAYGLHLYGALRQASHSLLGDPQTVVDRANLPTEVDALLDHEGGLAEYHRDDEWHQAVTEHYEQNLRRIVHIARQAGIPLILANPTSNIRDIVPFKSEFDSTLTNDERSNLGRVWEKAKTASWENLDSKLSATEAVLKIDPRYANALYLKAKVLEAMQRYDAAKAAYLQAKDQDICPLRMTEAMHERLRLVAAQTDTPLVDVRNHFDSIAEFGIPGDEELIDHVHPRMDGHQWIADLLFRQMESEGLVRTSTGWEARQKKLYNDNYGLLPENYFPEAVSRLEGLNRWARGRVGQIDPDAPPSANVD